MRIIESEKIKAKRKSKKKTDKQKFVSYWKAVEPPEYAKEMAAKVNGQR